MSRHERENKLESTTPSIQMKALSRDKLVKETVNELHDLGIIDLDESEVKPKKRKPTLNPRKILEIIKACKEKPHAEVQIAAKMIGEDTISCEQAEAIINTFSYDSIHPGPFLLEILPQISDPENIENLATKIFYYRDKIEKFMHTVKVCFPEGYEVTMPEEKPREIVTIVKQLSPLARYALLSIPILLVTNLVTLGALIWVIW